VIGRIKDPEIMDGTFVRPKDFQITNYLRNSFGIFKGQDDFEVVLELDRWGADILRGRRWHGSQQVTELPGGEIRMSFRLDSLEEIEPWVLSWGAHATVIRPKALADRVSAAADAVRKKYAKPAKPRNGQDQRELGLKANAARRPLTTNVVPPA